QPAPAHRGGAGQRRVVSGPEPLPSRDTVKRRAERFRRRLSRGHVALAAAGVFVIALLVGWGVSGALRIRIIQVEITAAERDIAALRARTITLTETIDRLRNDPGYLEKLAREEHGLVREGETVLKFPSRPK